MSAAGKDSTCGTAALGFCGYLMDTLALSGLILYVLHKRLQVPQGSTPDWGRPYRPILSGLLVAFLNSLPPLLLILVFNIVTTDIFAQQDIAVCNASIAFFVPPLIAVHPVTMLFFHKVDRLLPVATLLANRIRGVQSALQPSVNSTTTAKQPFRVLLVGSWGRGYFTHQISTLLREAAEGGEAVTVVETIHFDDEEDACIRQNLRLCGGDGVQLEKVHVALLDVGIHMRGYQGHGGVWWSQFQDRTFDVVVILPKTATSYPVKPTNMTPADSRASRMCVVLAEVLRVVRTDGGRILFADEPTGALTLLADLRLVTGGAITDDCVAISEEGKIGHISSRYDSRCIVVEVEGASCQMVQNPRWDSIASDKALSSFGTNPTAGQVTVDTRLIVSEDKSLRGAGEQEGLQSKIDHRDRALTAFLFQYGIALDYIVFAAAMIGAMALFDLTSVPSTIPRDLRFGTLFPMWAQIYPVASLMLRWRECDVNRYELQAWSSVGGIMRMYLRSQIFSFVVLTVFCILLNAPCFSIFVAIGNDDFPLPLDALNAMMKSGFFCLLGFLIVKNLKPMARRQLQERGVSEATLVEFFD